MAEARPPIKLVGEVSSHLTCPLCHKLYQDPVINIRCGHTFCRKCAFKATHCPVDNSHCDTSQLVINRLVVGQIDDLLIFCRYGLVEDGEGWQNDPSGCAEEIALGKRLEHESECPFGLVSCPNSNKCGSFQRRDVPGHVQQCSYTPCQHEESGCEFRGTPSHVGEHLTSCGYSRVSSSSASGVTKKVAALEQENRTLREQVSSLTQRVGELEAGHDDLSGQVTKYSSNMHALHQKYMDLYSTVESLLNSRNRGSFGMRMSESQSNLNSRYISSVPNSPPPHKYEKWDMPFHFKCIGTLRGHQDIVWCLTVYKGKLYSAGSDTVVKVWDLDSLDKGCINTLKGHTGIVQCLAATQGNLYTAGHDNSIRVWDTETGQCIKTIENAHDQIICAMAINSDNLFTASFSLIKVWDLKTMTMKQSLAGLHHWVRALAFNHEKDKLYSGSHNAINVWDLTNSFKSLGTIDHECGSVHSLVVTQEYIIAGNSGSEPEIQTFPPHEALSNNEAQFLHETWYAYQPGSYNQNIQLFNAKTHQHVINLCGHIGTVTSLVASPSGRFLFSGSHDCNIQVWSLEKNLPIQTLSRHQASVNSLALYGNFLLSGSEDHEIKVFRYFQLQHGHGVV